MLDADLVTGRLATDALATDALAALDDADLALVAGGADDNSFGRCGPGSRWPWLGDVYTNECRAHDAAVRGRLANGSSKFMAHVKSLPLLPAAVGSYVRERLR
jgi:hypothetical protein